MARDDPTQTFVANKATGMNHEDGKFGSATFYVMPAKDIPRAIVDTKPDIE
jgi:hypothetical protein